MISTNECKQRNETWMIMLDLQNVSHKLDELAGKQKHAAIEHDNAL